MVYFPKSKTPPPSLAIEKTKANGSYRKDDVLKQLCSDFKEKCYICEKKGLTDVNIEHFIPHRGDKTLKFSWENLFLACYHCNKTKSDKHTDILNCTTDSDIDKKIKHIFYNSLVPQVEIEAANPGVSDAAILATINLLRKVYNGKTPHQKLESANLRKQMEKEISEFNSLLLAYAGASFEEKEILRAKILEELDNASSFTAFKRG
jgi:uncharacterized protein (TIGR02646 family)